MRTAHLQCRKCGAIRDPDSPLALCEPCRVVYVREKSAEKRREAGAPVRSKSPVCSKCGGERDMRLAAARCRDCWRVESRERERVKRGTPESAYRPERYDPAPRKFPVGQCSQCGVEVVLDGKCKACLLAYRREWEAKRRAKNKAAAGPKLCRTIGCGRPTRTPRSKLCAACYGHSQIVKVTKATKARLTKAAVHKQMARPAPPAGRRWPEVAVVEARDIVIGPEAFERPKPVDIRKHKVTRVPAAGEWGR